MTDLAVKADANASQNDDDSVHEDLVTDDTAPSETESESESAQAPDAPVTDDSSPNPDAAPAEATGASPDGEDAVDTHRAEPDAPEARGTADGAPGSAGETPRVDSDDALITAVPLSPTSETTTDTAADQAGVSTAAAADVPADAPGLEEATVEETIPELTAAEDTAAAENVDDDTAAGNAGSDDTDDAGADQEDADAVASEQTSAVEDGPDDETDHVTPEDTAADSEPATEDLATATETAADPTETTPLIATDVVGEPLRLDVDAESAADATVSNKQHSPDTAHDEAPQGEASHDEAAQDEAAGDEASPAGEMTAAVADAEEPAADTTEGEEPAAADSATEDTGSEETAPEEDSSEEDLAEEPAPEPEDSVVASASGSAAETLAATAVLVAPAVDETATAPAVDETATAPAATDATAAPQESDVSVVAGPVEPPVARWAPPQPAPRKRRRKALWIGVAAAGVLVAGAAAASTILIAPGTTVAGVPVGWMTVGAAAEAVDNSVDRFEVSLDGSGATVSGSDLGATVDSQALTEQAFAAHPMWKVTGWGDNAFNGAVTLDTERAKSSLRQASPDSYTDPVDAAVAFDKKKNTFTMTPAENGWGIDLDALSAQFADALAQGDSSLTFSAEPAAVEAPVTDAEASETVSDLNGMLKTVGFYVGDERTVPVAPAVAGTWFTVVDDDGDLRIEVDEALIQKSVDELKKTVHREPVNAKVVVDSHGDVLRTSTEGVTGRALGDVSDMASRFASQLEAGDAKFLLPVTETPFTTTTLLRTIDINLTNQTVSAIENGKIVESWPVSTGVEEFATTPGSFTVNWKLDSQNMGDKDLKKPPFYYQPDVKWVMYFNGDEALHGVYWHDNWGTPMSHGCVGMPEWRAEWLYNWSPEGIEVSVHY